MSSISKFVINRNNIEYLYTEKEQFFDGIHFFVYEGNEPTEYYPDAFYDTFGSDLKLSVFSIISLIESDLVTHNIDTKNISSLLSTINSLKNRISSKDYRNPSLGQDKLNVIGAISLYNKLLSKKKIVEEHDYENDLIILNKYFGSNEEDSLIEKKEVVNEEKLDRSNIDFVSIKDPRVRSIDSKQEIA